MANHTDIGGSQLANGVSERLESLGMSMRELARRTGLSRQTIHNVVHKGSTNLQPATFKALDEALKWDTGTALAKALGARDPQETESKVAQYMQRIAVHLGHMSTKELELTLIMMEENQLGATNLPLAEFTTRLNQLMENCRTQIRLMEDEPHTNGRAR